MRRLLIVALLALAGLAGSLRAAEVSFIRVWPGWRSAESFKRISEYFDNQENDGGWIVARTRPKDRAGYYFLARVDHPATSLDGARFVLQVILPTDPVPRTFSFLVACPPGNHVFDLGITGTDWAGKSVHPVAWRLDLVARDGALLASKQSFLWAQPAK